MHRQLVLQQPHHHLANHWRGAPQLLPPPPASTTTAPRRRRRPPPLRHRVAPAVRRHRTVRAMRAVVQRVASASVAVDGQVVSSIGRGWLCLVGLTADDGEADAEFVAKKLLRTRGWPDPESGAPWAKDVAGIDGELLLVSQFTLYGRLKKPKPDFSRAMANDQAREAYGGFVERMRGVFGPGRVKDGVFGAMMEVALVNDGPVTFVIDSHHQERPS